MTEKVNLNQSDQRQIKNHKNPLSMTAISRPAVHILGLGAMGTVLGVDLSRFTNAMIIPLFRSKEKMNKFKCEGQSTIGIRKIYDEKSPLFLCKIEKSDCPETFKGERIKNLVVTTKTYQTKDALKPYLPYIDSDTNLILIQNGLGILEILKDEVFTDRATRPQLFQGVISHGVYLDEGYIFNHAGWAPMKIARLPWEESEIIQQTGEAQKDLVENELVKLLMQEPFVKEFGTQQMTYQELLVGQLYKFLVNACINPVTSIVDSVNGEIVDDCTCIFTLIVEECLQVLRASYPQLFEYEANYADKPEYPQFKVESVLNLNHMVQQIIEIGCIINAKNSSSMRQDTLYLRDTEIEYINGYIVKLAAKFKIDAKVNKTIETLVNLRLGLNRRRNNIGDWRNAI